MNVDNLPASVGSANWEIPDPGDDGTIPGYKTGYVEIVTAGAETRTIAAPAKPGLKLLIYGKTLVGACTIAVTNYIGSDDSLVLSTAGVPRVLESVREGSTLTWKQTSGASWESLAATSLTATAITTSTLNASGAAQFDGNVGMSANLTLVGDSGDAVTQSGSITTTVAIDANSGQITTVSTTLAAGVDASFTVTNSAVAATDLVLCHTKSYGGTADGIPIAKVQSVGSGSFIINLHNQGAVALDAAVVITFAVIKLTYI